MENNINGSEINIPTLAKTVQIEAQLIVLTDLVVRMYSKETDRVEDEVRDNVANRISELSKLMIDELTKKIDSNIVI